MSGKPVWMEDWKRHASGGIVRNDPGISGVVLLPGNMDAERADLAAAAPQLVRALLAVEWEGEYHDGETWITGCVRCGSSKDAGHASLDSCGRDCELDAALTAAGFPDQASRDEARKVMMGGDQ